MNDDFNSPLYFCFARGGWRNFPNQKQKIIKHFIP